MGAMVETGEAAAAGWVSGCATVQVVEGRASSNSLVDVRGVHGHSVPQM